MDMSDLVELVNELDAELFTAVKKEYPDATSVQYLHNPQEEANKFHPQMRSTYPTDTPGGICVFGPYKHGIASVWNTNYAHIIQKYRIVYNMFLKRMGLRASNIIKRRHLLVHGSW